eukprot:14774436-Alexandrium_andersonii.AAC.1
MGEVSTEDHPDANRQPAPRATQQAEHNGADAACGAQASGRHCDPYRQPTLRNQGGRSTPWQGGGAV